MSGFYDVTLRNCSTGQQLLIAATVAMEFMTTVAEGEDRRCYSKEDFEFFARYDKGEVIITKL